MKTLRHFPAPPVDTWPRRACLGADINLFFADNDTAVGKRRQVEAKRLCGRCRARPQCLAYALPIGDLYGVWAGLNAGERTRVRKKKEAQ